MFAHRVFFCIWCDRFRYFFIVWGFPTVILLVSMYYNIWDKHIHLVIAVTGIYSQPRGCSNRLRINNIIRKWWEVQGGKQTCDLLVGSWTISEMVNWYLVHVYNLYGLYIRSCLLIECITPYYINLQARNYRYEQEWKLLQRNLR